VKKFFVFVTLVVAAGCSTPKTLGSLCNLIDNASCKRAFECNAIREGVTQEQCVAVFDKVCCQDQCDHKIKSETMDFAAKCAKAIATWPCEQLSQAILPPECQETEPSSGN